MTNKILNMIAVFVLGAVIGFAIHTAPAQHEPPQGQIILQDGRTCQEYDQTPNNFTPHMWKQAYLVWVGCK